MGPAPSGPQYPATWTVSGNVATGTTASGVVVTATLTGPAAWFSPSTGPLVFTGTTPGYLPATTTQALLPEITGCGDGADLASDPSCGSITYSFSRPVMAPVLYVGDIGTGSIDAGVFTDVPRFAVGAGLRDIQPRCGRLRNTEHVHLE